MSITRSIPVRVASLLILVVALTITSSRTQADTANCGPFNRPVTMPFTDVIAGNVFFCSIAEVYFSGLANGTGPTTYAPAASVPREQMAAFVSRTLDQSLKRGSQRGALNRWEQTFFMYDSQTTTVGNNPQGVQSDGADLWVANNSSNTVSRVRASDGKLLETWTGATFPRFILATRGRIYLTAQGIGGGPGKVYTINPRLAPGAVTVLSADIGPATAGITTDGYYIWTAGSDLGSPGLARVDPESGVTVKYSAGFSNPIGILYDGTSIWVTDTGDDTLKRIDNNGVVVQTVSNCGGAYPVFDGTNIWVPTLGLNSVKVVRASTGALLATLTDPTLQTPLSAAFDGQRVLVTNTGGTTVTMWKAADLGVIGTYPLLTTGGAQPFGVCSDGINFWITITSNKLARF